MHDVFNKVPETMDTLVLLAMSHGRPFVSPTVFFLRNPNLPFLSGFILSAVAWLM